VASDIESIRGKWHWKYMWQVTLKACMSMPH